jgi:cytochrome P450
MDFNPSDPAFRADPYPVYARLREAAPVLQTPLNFYAVSRYDDVSFVLRNPQIFSSAAMGAAGLAGPGSRTIISTDPPDHTMLRNLVNRAFTPRMVEAMEPRIRAVARQLLDAAGGGEFDLIDALAIPLPVTIIAEILGVEPERRHDFKRWSNAVVATTAELNTDAAHDQQEFRDYFDAGISARTAEPRDDLISALVRAREHDATLTRDEIVGLTMLLLIAGNETTTNLIGNAMLALLEHPDQLRLVAGDASLIPNMVEEALRFDSPVQFLFRSTTRDTELAGTAIPAGRIVVPIYASGNRDERRFPEGARFDVTRNTQGHLAFGLGIHFCLGAPLARLEARVAFEEIFARYGSIELAGPIERLDSPVLRGLRRLPLRVGAA